MIRVLFNGGSGFAIPQTDDQTMQIWLIPAHNEERIAMKRRPCSARSSFFRFPDAVRTTAAIRHRIPRAFQTAIRSPQTITLQRNDTANPIRDSAK